MVRVFKPLGFFKNLPAFLALERGVFKLPVAGYNCQCQAKQNRTADNDEIFHNILQMNPNMNSHPAAAARRIPHIIYHGRISYPRSILRRYRSAARSVIFPDLMTARSGGIGGRN